MTAVDVLILASAAFPAVYLLGLVLSAIEPHLKPLWSLLGLGDEL